LDLMLEDIGKIREFSDCIVKAKKITRFIYAHGRILDQMRSLNGKRDLVKAWSNSFCNLLPHIGQPVETTPTFESTIC